MYGGGGPGGPKNKKKVNFVNVKSEPKFLCKITFLEDILHFFGQKIIWGVGVVIYTLRMFR